MKTLLIVPPFYRFLGSRNNNMSLGLSYVAAAIGGDVKIYNADAGSSFADQTDLFENSKAFQKAVEDLGHPAYKEIEAILDYYKPEKVGITVTSPTYVASINIRRLVHWTTKATVFVGGPHITLVPDSAFDTSFPGAYVDITKITPNRDCYINDNIDKSYIVTGIGCCNSCSFCASQKLWKGITLKSIDSIIEELKTMHKDVYFVDDTFTLRTDRAKEICRRIIEEKLDIRWRCDTRLDRLDEELIMLMKKSGCVRIKVGVESGSNRILSQINKGINRKIIDKSIELIKKIEIPFTVYLMAGFPNETDEDLEKTIEFAKWAEADYYSLSIVTPYPGTKLYDDWQGNWQYLHHQMNKPVLTDKISDTKLKDFMEVNRYAKGTRK